MRICFAFFGALLFLLQGLFAHDSDGISTHFYAGGEILPCYSWAVHHGDSLLQGSLGLSLDFSSDIEESGLVGFRTSAFLEDSLAHSLRAHENLYMLTFGAELMAMNHTGITSLKPKVTYNFTDESWICAFFMGLSVEGYKNNGAFGGKFFAGFEPALHIEDRTAGFAIAFRTGFAFLFAPKRLHSS